MKFAPVFVLGAVLLHSETGYQAWLRYARLDEPGLSQYRQSVPAVIIAEGDSILIGSARDELIRGIRGMLGRTLRIEKGPPGESAIVLRVSSNAAADSYS